MHNRYSFLGGNSGKWRVLSVAPVKGEPLAQISHLEILPSGDVAAPCATTWSLAGVISNLRYANRSELSLLRQRQESIGRDKARRAALIPIKKSAAWWDLAQDERRAIFEEQSRHTAIGMDYLPQIARQLYHCRDLSQPFDFLTWFEFAPEHSAAFEELVSRLRTTREWSYIEREVDIRLERSA